MTKCCSVKWDERILRCLHCGRHLKGERAKMETSRDFEMKQMFGDEQ